jgi:hypothetical protein
MFNRRWPVISGLVLAAVALLPVHAQAHERDFTMLRDWFLPYKGEREIEYRFTHIKGGDFNAHEVEFEYGVNSHFAVEPGIEFVKENGGKLHVDGYDAELRFNFGEFRPNVILPALNVEYEHPVDRAEDDHGELKFIGSMYDDYGNDFTINVNVGWALEHRRERESELLLGYMHPTRQGMGHRGDGWKYGFEFAHDLEGSKHSVIGPTATFRATENLHFLATYAFGLDSHEDNTFKLIAEWEFNK